MDEASRASVVTGLKEQAAWEESYIFEDFQVISPSLVLSLCHIFLECLMLIP